MNRSHHRSHQSSHDGTRHGRRFGPIVGLAMLWAASACVVAPPPGAEGEGEGEGEGEVPSCDDPVLGGFELQPGYVVIESAPVPADITSAAISSASGGPARLFAMGADLIVYDLGAWPALTDARAPLFDVLTTADEALAPGSEAFASFLVVDGAAAATGYTRLSDYGGAVGKHAVSESYDAWLDAPANFSATILGDLLLVNGAGLDDAHDGLGVYGWSEDARFLVATLGASATGSGYLAATADGVVVAGRYTTKNELFAVGPAELAARLAGGDVIDLDAGTPILTGSFGALAGFGAAVAALTYDPVSFATTGLVDVALPVSNGTVTAGSAVAVLQLREGCTTAIPFVSPHDGDVLVGVTSGGGTRAVRIARQ